MPLRYTADSKLYISFTLSSFECLTFWHVMHIATNNFVFRFYKLNNERDGSPAARNCSYHCCAESRIPYTTAGAKYSRKHSSRRGVSSRELFVCNPAPDHRSATVVSLSHTCQGRVQHSRIRRAPIITRRKRIHELYEHLRYAVLFELQASRTRQMLSRM